MSTSEPVQELKNEPTVTSFDTTDSDASKKPEPDFFDQFSSNPKMVAHMKKIWGPRKRYVEGRLELERERSEKLRVLRRSEAALNDTSDRISRHLAYKMAAEIVAIRDGSSQRSRLSRRWRRIPNLWRSNSLHLDDVAGNWQSGSHFPQSVDDQKKEVAKGFAELRENAEREYEAKLEKLREETCPGWRAAKARMNHGTGTKNS